MTSCELLTNGDFENGFDGWSTCWGFVCEVLDAAQSHHGSHAIRAGNRTQYWQGPSQKITVEPGKDYKAQSWVKILNDLPDKLGTKIELEVSFHFPDNTNDYINVAMWPMVRSSDGWILLEGEFQAPLKPVQDSSFYYQGADPGVDFAVDQASVTEVVNDPNWRNQTDDVINRIRKSDIHVNVTAAATIDKSAVTIQVLQTKKSFPFGAAINSWMYVDPAQQTYRDFLHKHFNWAVQGNALKWRQFDWNQTPGSPLYSRALNTILGLRQAGLKLRGHNMVWSVEEFIPISVKAQSGDQLRATVKEHINFVMNATRGYLENWDVNNENLHGQWFQNRLHDRDYDLELFRMMYAADPVPKLFLNDYNVVAQGAGTSAYLAQALRFKNAPGVHLAGIGVQTHFMHDQEPNPTLIKAHLDKLATVGVPIWVTELDVNTADQQLRADWYEKALRAVYGHPAVEGIIFWGWQGDEPATQIWAAGNNMQLNAAGHRVLDLLENEWMTDESHLLARAGDRFTVRGFHGNYTVHVFYRGQELTNLRTNFTLGTTAANVNVNVHV